MARETAEIPAMAERNDQAAPAIDDFVRDLNGTAATAFTAGDADGTLHGSATATRSATRS